MRLFKRKKYRIIISKNNQYSKTFTLKCTYDEACMVAQTIASYMSEDDEGAVAIVTVR